MRTCAKANRLAVIMVSALMIVMGTAQVVWGLGMEDVGNAAFSERNYEEWQGTEIMPVINHPSRVYHTWVNGNEHFYYSGDAKALNEVLKLFAVVKVDAKEVVIRPGPAGTKTFKGEPIAYDWKLHLLTGLAAHDHPPGSWLELEEKNPTITISTGSGNFDLASLQIPEGITIVGPEELRARYVNASDVYDGRTVGLAMYRLAGLEPYNRKNASLITSRFLGYRRRLNQSEADNLAISALEMMGESASGALPDLKKALPEQSEEVKERLEKAIRVIETAPLKTAEAKAHREAVDEIKEFLKTVPGQDLLAQDKKGSFTLYVSNQSAHTPVDISVYIDGKLAVMGDFYTITSHNWKRFQFNLAPGTHTIKAVSTKGKAKIERTFEVKNKHWAVINYWYNPKDRDDRRHTPRQFSFDIQARPMNFM